VAFSLFEKRSLMLILVLWMALGLVILTAGAESMVRGASSLAIAMKISPLVVGLTVVAYGTGAPELVVSLQALANGQGDITIGNVIGSNIYNILITLGFAAMITPLVVSQQLIRFDVPLLIILSVMFGVFSLDGRIEFGEAVVFASSLAVYTFWAIYKSRREQKKIEKQYEAEFGVAVKPSIGNIAFELFLVALGLGLLLYGAQMFLDNAVILARQFGMSELMIGLTLVAAGTSLPELATTVTAALRGDRDIAVGNAIGSSLFNIMGVLGISGMVAQNGLPVSSDALIFDIPVLIAVSVACLPVFFIGHKIERWEGAVFVGYYVAYTTYMVLEATDSTVTRTFSVIMLGFVIPLTVITCLIGLYRTIFLTPKVSVTVESQAAGDLPKGAAGSEE